MVLLLWFVGAAAIPASPPATSPPELTRPPETQQAAATPRSVEPDQRGTKALPLVVETVEAIGELAEKKTNADHRKQEAANSRSTMLLTGGMLLIAFFQACLFFRQLRLMRPTIEAAYGALKIGLYAR